MRLRRLAAARADISANLTAFLVAVEADLTNVTRAAIAAECRGCHVDILYKTAVTINVEAMPTSGSSNALQPPVIASSVSSSIGVCTQCTNVRTFTPPATTITSCCHHHHPHHFHHHFHCHLHRLPPCQLRLCKLFCVSIVSSSGMLK